MSLCYFLYVDSVYISVPIEVLMIWLLLFELHLLLFDCLCKQHTLTEVTIIFLPSLVFGASGLTAQECVYQALKDGDTVVGLTRNPSNVVVPKGSGGSDAEKPLTDPNLTVIAGTLVCVNICKICTKYCQYHVCFFYSLNPHIISSYLSNERRCLQSCGCCKR